MKNHQSHSTASTPFPIVNVISFIIIKETVVVDMYMVEKPIEIKKSVFKVFQK